MIHFAFSMEKRTLGKVQVQSVPSRSTVKLSFLSPKCMTDGRTGKNQTSKIAVNEIISRKNWFELVDILLSSFYNVCFSFYRAIERDDVGSVSHFVRIVYLRRES